MSFKIVLIIIWSILLLSGCFTAALGYVTGNEKLKEKAWPMFAVWFAYDFVILLLAFIFDWFA